ncbi:Ig-like domain-containing protein [Catenovulum sediminis]|uniref:beta-fructofuranosidase n=1 Tax=Catenovulum sediminis TaxID=1740262 RepID=A0ABV1RC60_9ALTE
MKNTHTTHNNRKSHSLKRGFSSMVLTTNLVLTPALLNAQTILHLPFDEANGSNSSQEQVTGNLFTNQFTNNPPERVPGISGNAFRTDGYSTWMTGPFDYNSLNQITVESWIALESYPSTAETNLQDSSLLHQKEGDLGFNLGINTYGQWWLEINVSGQMQRIDAPSNFPLYNWTHLAFTVDNGVIRLFLNGQQVADKIVPAGNVNLAPTAPLTIGRAFDPQISFNVFEVNAINAAYDEIKIDDAAKSASDFLSVYNAGKDTPWQEAIDVPETRFADDHLRPRYHAMPPANWTNEPHGLVAYNGKYHMFYQRTPNGPYKWMMHWGNMVSSDFVNWQNLKDAFYPRLNINGQQGLGSKGIWSGDVVVDANGTAHAFYTTVNFGGPYDPGVAWATSTDANLEEWTLHGGIIDKNNPNPGGIADFRDPYLWQEGNSWHMIIGSATGSSGGVEYYTTSDINSGNWVRSPHSFSTVPYSTMDIGSAIWEMPVFEYIGTHNGLEKYALVVSPIGGSMQKTQAPYVRSVYWTGTWQKDPNGGPGQFTPDYTQPKNLDVIHGHLSPTVARNSDGNLVAIGIVDERTHSQFQNDLGWAHTYSLPRVWQLLEDGQTIGQTPANELTDLRLPGSLVSQNNLSVNGEHKLSASGDQIEMIIELDPNTAANQYGFIISASPDKAEFTKIYYDGDNIVIDKSNSTLTAGFEESGVYSDVYDESIFGKPQKFQVFVDHSAIAVFINDKAVFANRIYPSRADSTELYLYSQGATTLFNKVDVYQLDEAAGVEQTRISLADDGFISEEAEHGEVINVSVSNNTFKSTLNASTWQFENLPEGVSFGNVTRLSDTQVTIELIGDTTIDYDEDITNAQLAIPASEFVVEQLPTTVYGGGIKFTAEIEPVTAIALSSQSEIVEGSENGQQITVSLTNNTFATPLNLNHWSISNLPSGVSYSVDIVDSQTATITLSGSATDYDNDIYNFKVDIAPDAFGYADPELNGGNVIANSGIVFKSFSGELVYDFESADLQNWCITQGNAFSDADVTSTSSWHAGSFLHNGNYHMWGFFEGEDATVGEMRTGEFVLEGDGQIEFLISGGRDINNLYFTLVDAATGLELFKETGSDSEIYQNKTWDASAYIGQSVYLKLVDNSSGGWGHINLDYVRVPVPDHLDGVIPSANTTPVTDVSISAEHVTLEQGQSSQLFATVSPVLACNKRVNWSSDNTNVATVDASGFVTAINPGNASVIATSQDGNFTDAVLVTVAEPAPLLVFDFETADLSNWIVAGNAFSQGDISTESLYWGSEPFGHQGNFHLWGFSEGGDTGTGSLTSANFVLAGDGIIKAKLAGGNDINNLYLAVVRASDQAVLLKATGHDSEGYREVVLDASAYIGQTLNIRLVDNSTAGFGHLNVDDIRIPVSNTNTYIAVNGVSVNPVNSELELNQVLQLNASVSPSNATNQAIESWVSSDSSIVQIDNNGAATAVNYGSATITATTEDGGHTAIVQISVVDNTPTPEPTPEPEPGTISFDFESGDLTGWTASGTAFSVGDVTAQTTYWGSEPFNHQGDFHLWSFAEGGDAQTGSLASDSFILGGDGQVNLKVSGGNNINELYVALVRVSDGAELAKVTGTNSETYVDVILNGSAFVGTEVAIKVVDNATGGWGHINVDAISATTGAPVNYLTYDFESNDLNDWTLFGDAFTVADLSTDTCYWAECVAFNHQGNQHLWGFKDGGDSQTGEMHSQIFTLGGNGQISLLLGGGNDINQLYIALVDANTQQELVKVTANNSEAYVEKVLDGSAYVGQSLYIKVIDNATGGWGHLNIDHIQIPVQ